MDYYMSYLLTLVALTVMIVTVYSQTDDLEYCYSCTYSRVPEETDTDVITYGGDLNNNYDTDAEDRSFTFKETGDVYCMDPYDASLGRTVMCDGYCMKRLITKDNGEIHMDRTCAGSTCESSDNRNEDGTRTLVKCCRDNLCNGADPTNSSAAKRAVIGLLSFALGVVLWNHQL